MLLDRCYIGISGGRNLSVQGDELGPTSSDLTYAGCKESTWSSCTTEHEVDIVPFIVNVKYDLQTSIRVLPSTNTFPGNVAGCILVPSLSVLFYNTLISFSQKRDWIGALLALSPFTLPLRSASIDCTARLNLSVSRPFIILAALLQVHATIKLNSFRLLVSNEEFFCMKFWR